MHPVGDNPIVATADRSITRKHYAFALRDAIPVATKGWSVVRHNVECRGLDQTNCCDLTSNCQTADICRLFSIEYQDSRFSEAFDGLSTIITQFVTVDGERARARAMGPQETLPARRCYAMVGAAWNDDMQTSDHYERCFGMLRDAVTSLRHATQARTPNLEIERVWPMYLVLNEYSDGEFSVQNMILVTHGFHEVPIPSARQYEQARNSLLAAWTKNPVEIYHDFTLNALRAWDTDGDYVGAILKAAAAAEVLLKHCAWMLTWEATQTRAADPRPAVGAPAATFDMKPSGLIGSILSQRLGGNWSIKDPELPVGRWRNDIARVRNAIIHRGYRPTTAEAGSAVSALGALETHVCDRLASSASNYPRTALLLAGKYAIERRGAWGKVRATYEGTSLQEVQLEYLDWLDTKLGSDAED